MKSLAYSIFVIFLITITQLSPTPLKADTPSGFFPIGTDFRIGSRNVYFVNSASDFRNIADDSSGIYLIMNNIDMDGTHIENLSTFTGIIHGFGHTISNMRFDNDQLIATSNSGVIERINFANILIDSGTSTNATGLLFQTNNGRISDLYLSISNATDAVTIPPLVNSNNDRMLNIVVDYDIESDIDENFFFYSGLSDTSDVMDNVWMRGTINVSTTGIFNYRSMGSRNSFDYCVDDINVNVNTASSINNSFGSRCYYSSNDSDFQYSGAPFEKNTVTNYTDQEAVVSTLDSRFTSSRWNSTATTLTLVTESRYNVAGEHVYQVETESNTVFQLNLYRSPVFNSEQLDYTLFTENVTRDFGTFSEEVTYSTNYSRVLINGEEVSRSQTIEQFGLINLRLESDYNLPTLEISLRIEPELNFSDGMEVGLGFNPTTSLGFLTSNGSFLFTDETLDEEGEYSIEVNYGNSERVFTISVIPEYSGVRPNEQRTSSFTPIITASSVTINGEAYDDPQTFTELGTYDVVFENIPSFNFSFQIIPELNRQDIYSESIAERISLQNNFEELKINGEIFNEQFVASRSAIVHSTGSTITLNLPYGRHILDVQGVNDYTFSYRIENEPQIDIVQESTTERLSVSVTGADLFINDAFIEDREASFIDIGNYDVEVRYFSDDFNLDANESVINQTYSINPSIQNISNGGRYTGSITPLISGSGMSLFLNDASVDITQINKEFDVPGDYQIEIQGTNQFSDILNYSVRVAHNLLDNTFYDEVDLQVTSPNNTVYYRSPDNHYPESEETFDYDISLRKPGVYVIETLNFNEEVIDVTRFEILPVAYRFDARDDFLSINISNLHPDVQIIINGVVRETTNNLDFTAAGQYNLSFDSSLDGIVYETQTHVISPQIEPRVADETNQVIRYQISNDIEEFYLNGRLIENEVFLENQTFSINQNGENSIRIVGENNYIFEYVSNFNNPHFNNVTRLSVFAIITSAIGILSIVGRYLLAVRHDR